MSKQKEMKLKIITQTMTDIGVDHWKNWTAYEISTWIKNHFTVSRYISNKASLIIFNQINER